MVGVGWGDGACALLRAVGLEPITINLTRMNVLGDAGVGISIVIIDDDMMCVDRD